MYKNIDKSKYTPMMRQYLDIKEKYPDTLVFFRLGDFYEMFFNDAIVASRELEIVLTGRDAGVEERVPMCGVPFHSVDTYIQKLTDKGYKVAIVEQLEEPNPKKIVERDVIRIITPGTNIDEKSLNDKSNIYIGAIEKGNNNYSFAYIELSTGETKVTTLPNNINLVINEINKLSIREVVVSNSFNKSIINQLEKIYGILISINDDIKVDSYLEDLLTNLKEEQVLVCKRLLSYIIQTQKRVLVHLKPFVEYTTKDYLRLDSNSVTNLELVESLRSHKTKNNLFAILDKCSTAMGSRFLKKSIIYPLIDYNKINNRLDLVEEFSKNYLLTTDIRKDLQSIYDLERIVGRISYGNLSPKDLLQLRKSLEVIPNIKYNLSKFKHKAVVNLHNSIEEFRDLYELLFSSINEDCGYLLRDGNVIKEGYNEELDQIRNISSSNKTFLINLEQRERERTGIKTLKVGYNKVFGYYIEITKSYLHLVKDEFGYIRKQTTSNSERFITEELKEREALILRSDETALALEIKLFNEIRNICKNHSNELQNLATIISEMDMLITFNIVSKENNYVRPIFSLYDELEIKDGRHPVIEKNLEKEFIPNDLTMYNNDKILLITGPNMSGKSTFMRQNALIVIMAQMGCFVPCSYAKLPIFDQIFTRIGSSDDIASGESTFMSEMLEVNFALSNATERSLIIFDEVGRGTATYDGMALAQAIIEYIHNNIGCKMLFSTHYHELTNLETHLGFLHNVHVEASTEDEDHIVFLHKVLPGASDKSYGINVASLAKLPIEVTLRAADILRKIENSNKYDSDLFSLDNYQEPIIIDKTNPIHNQIINELKDCDIEKLSPIEALLLISKLKEKLNDE